MLLDFNLCGVKYELRLLRMTELTQHELRFLSAWTGPVPPWQQVIDGFTVPSESWQLLHHDPRPSSRYPGSRNHFWLDNIEEEVRAEGKASRVCYDKDIKGICLHLYLRGVFFLIHSRRVGPAQRALLLIEYWRMGASTKCCYLFRILRSSHSRLQGRVICADADTADASAPFWRLFFIIFYWSNIIKLPHSSVTLKSLRWISNRINLG